jgi:hypothetical protein
MRRKLFGPVCVILLLVAAQPAAAGVQRVRDLPVREYGYAIDRFGGETVRAWSADSAQRRYLFSVYWQRGGQPPTRRTGPTTPAYVGGLDLGNSRGQLLSYEAYSGQTDSWDVRLYDIDGGHAVTVPPGVNTRSDETHPTVSGDHLLFQRGNVQGPKRAILVDLDTGAIQKQKVAAPNGLVLADQVNGDYAVFTICPANRHCRIHRYRISTEVDEGLPNANRAAYSSTVTSTGVVYYAIGHPTRCGVNTQIHRWTHGPSAPRIQLLSDGIEVATTWAYERPGGGVSVYFTRLVCQPNGFRSGIYSIEG